MTIEKKVEIFVNKTGPILGLVNVDTTESSITIIGSASDTIAGLSPNPYRHSVGLLSSDWGTSSQYNQSIEISSNQSRSSYYSNKQICEETAFSAPTTGSTMAAPPASLSAVIGQRWIKITWPGTTGAARYDIEADGVIVDNGMSTK